MNHPRLAFLGLLAGLVAATSFTSIPSAQAAPPAPTPAAPAPVADAGAATHIGVVDLRLVYATMQETQDAQRDFRGRQDAYDLKVKQDKEDLEALAAKISRDYKAGTDAREKAMEDYDAKTIALQQEEQGLKIKAFRAQSKQLVQAYNEIKDAVADMAKKKGLDLVLVKSGTDALTGAADIGNQETLVNLIFGRSVLYASDKVDMSQEVITALDAAYKAAGAKPAAPAAPAGH